MPAPRLALLAPSENLLDWAAAQILEQHRGALPDLSAVTVLLPSGAAIAPLRERLLAGSGGALLGPQILTLAAYAAQRGEPLAALSPLDCRLQLAQALAAYQHLFPQQDVTQLAEDFFVLFEELSLNVPDLADDAENFLRRVARGYGADVRLFSEEARMVHVLWRAWLTQSGGASPAAVYARQLANALQQESGALYLIGFDQFSRAESAALRRVLAEEKAHLWIQGRREGRDGAAMRELCAQLGIEPEAAGPPPRNWIDALLEPGAALRQRLQGMQPPPGLRIQPARSPEHEARIAELAIRQWLLAGKKNLVVISQDRRFARRLRALLERAGVPLRDEAGWALSTSSAASALMHWLDCVEQGFHFRPLLALLRSHAHDPEARLAESIDALERAIYASSTVSGLKRLQALTDGAPQLLATLESAAQPLVLHAGERPAKQWSAALLQSLQSLPMWQQFALDEAGSQIVALLEGLDDGLNRAALKLDWAGFRRVLQRLLEAATFKPEAARGPVRLLTMDQTAALSCDALILTGAAAGKFPAVAAAPSLFNQAVRAELGLPHARAALQLALARFRALLDAAPEVLISYAPEDESEPAQACAWVELLLAAEAADARELAALAGSAAVEIAAVTATAPAVTAPKPPAQAALLPAALSASTHQALIDCPYRFHVTAALGLRALQEPDEPYSRRDFGDSVHAVLSRFTAPVDESQRAATEARMAAAATEVFGPDLRARALTRAWLAEFDSLIPEIVGWMIERRGDWPQADAEAKLRMQLDEKLELLGRADRLEKNAAGLGSVVDYKTGAAPRKDDVETGEAVQATHYALMAGDCEQVEYLQLKRDDFKSSRVAGEALADAAHGVLARLQDVMRSLHQGAAQPAHGDAATCERCDYSGLCRKGAWADG